MTKTLLLLSEEGQKGHVEHAGNFKHHSNVAGEPRLCWQEMELKSAKDIPWRTSQAV